MTSEYSIGLGKTIFNSSVAVLPMENYREVEIAISERFNRIKNSGAWPERPLSLLSPVFTGKKVEIRENRDVQTTLEFETYIDSRIPLRERLKSQGLSSFSTLEGEIHLVSHHMAHAYASVLFAPFEKALVFILDGAGTKSDEGYEYLSLFRWQSGKLELLQKKYLTFVPSKIPNQSFCEGIGLFYEKISEFIFHTKTEAGKVMGLAPFGKSMGIVKDYARFLEDLDWSKQYQGKSKYDWQASPHLDLYRDLAATVQDNFEDYVMNYLRDVSVQYPDLKNIIFSGGCALNCTFNGKLSASSLFEKFYIPPNPGDESIGLGCAASYFFEKSSSKWEATPWKELTSSRGLKASVPRGEEIKAAFQGHEITHPDNLISLVADLLNQGQIVGWFQGRSECGPRSLGNRSLLASPLRKDLKKYLNQNIKFREDFRPYGCSVLWEKAHEYFDINQGFDNPFMSFAVPVRAQFAEKLKDVTHIDGTSRMQTVHEEQNKKFHSLLKQMEKESGLPILLNTSLNVMNEPIVETVEDAFRFFQGSEVEYMVVGDYLIRKKGALSV